VFVRGSVRGWTQGADRGVESKAPCFVSRWRHRTILRPSPSLACIDCGPPQHRRRIGRPEKVTTLDTLNAVRQNSYSDVHQTALRTLGPHDFRSHGTKVEHIATTNERNASFPQTPVTGLAARNSHWGRGLSSPLFPHAAPGPIDLANHLMLWGPIGEGNDGNTPKAGF